MVSPWTWSADAACAGHAGQDGSRAGKSAPGCPQRA
ncbi:hypothetical protein SFR_2108 [Streptomyces sp. FR-008]|nr:hypothetical protein SFR_2108 [Streptomyces sp. FR-008]